MDKMSIMPIFLDYQYMSVVKIKMFNLSIN